MKFLKKYWWQFQKGFAPLIIIVVTMLVIGIGAGSYLVIREPASTMTFEVTVPQNTPPDDIIYIYTNDQQGKRMKKIDSFTHRVKLAREQIGIDEREDTVKYRYTRNNANFWTAEYLEPDTNDYFWEKLGHQAPFRIGKIQRDVISRWRWFPPDDVPIVSTTSLEPVGDFLPRINSEPFRSGQILEDLFIEGFRDHFITTAKHLKEIGYTWVEIDPPWQWTEENGLPKVANLVKDNPNYPDDETLIEEIRALKTQGLKVMLGPQICCTPLTIQGRSKGWWDAYFAATTEFLVHFAKIAEETGVDAMHYAVSADYQESDYATRWSAVFREIRKHFSGEVGEMVWNATQGPSTIFPDADFITWGNELDYFYVAIDTPISKSNNPTDDELKLGASRMLDGTKQLYGRYKKPVFVRTTYFNVKKTWKGNSYYSISSIPWISDPEQKLRESQYEFGHDDQAQVIQAYFRAIAERPWIIGYAQFGYTHWEYPLAADLSVRGKPSEDLWRKWNRLIYKF